ncbi:MAG: DUF4423 domain-containing protein [Pseudobdellovibrio sp.]|nr:DUF4423 domain-containing protein [Pseudobdellovibrio sp.]
MKPYEFDQFKDFFEYHLREKSINSRGRKTTLHRLAKKLGYSSPSTLSMISSGARLPTVPLLEALFKEWNVSDTNQDRIRLKIEIEQKQRKGKKISHLLAKYNRLTPYHKIDLKNYHVVRDWYVLVIKLMAGSSEFNEDPLAISQNLRKKITPAQAKKALQLLLQTGLLQRDPNTKKLVPTEANTETTHELASEAIRENHKGMMTRAIEAIEEQSLQQRHFNSLALQFESKKMAAAKKRILDFVSAFNDEFGSDTANQVYQLNVHFFEHTNQGNSNEP